MLERDESFPFFGGLPFFSNANWLVPGRLISINQTYSKLFQHGCWTKNNGTPKSSHLFMGLSLIFTIHFGGSPIIVGNILIFTETRLEVSNFKASILRLFLEVWQVKSGWCSMACGQPSPKWFMVWWSAKPDWYQTGRSHKNQIYSLLWDAQPLKSTLGLEGKNTFWANRELLKKHSKHWEHWYYWEHPNQDTILYYPKLLNLQNSVSKTTPSNKHQLSLDVSEQSALQSFLHLPYLPTLFA